MRIILFRITLIKRTCVSRTVERMFLLSVDKAFLDHAQNIIKITFICIIIQPSSPFDNIRRQ